MSEPLGGGGFESVEREAHLDGAAAEANPRGSGFRSELRRALRIMVAARWPVFAMGILALAAIAAAFGPWLAPFDPNRQNLLLRLADPMNAGPEGSVFWLGSDALGRDVLSRLLYGARISLTVGFAAIAVGGTIGIVAGLLAGYFGGWVDDVIMRLGDIQLAFPFILLAIMFLVVLGSGVWNLVLVLGIGQWVTYARIVRADTLSLRERSSRAAASTTTVRSTRRGRATIISPPGSRRRATKACSTSPSGPCSASARRAPRASISS